MAGMPVPMKMPLFVVVIFLLMGLQFAQFIRESTAHKAFACIHKAKNSVSSANIVRWIQLYEGK